VTRTKQEEAEYLLRDSEIALGCIAELVDECGLSKSAEKELRDVMIDVACDVAHHTKRMLDLGATVPAPVCPACHNDGGYCQRCNGAGVVKFPSYHDALKSVGGVAP